MQPLRRALEQAGAHCLCCRPRPVLLRVALEKACTLLRGTAAQSCCGHAGLAVAAQADLPPGGKLSMA
jgi:hypothetical protein